MINIFIFKNLGQFFSYKKKCSKNDDANDAAEELKKSGLSKTDIEQFCSGS